MFCLRCGAQNADTAERCANCGEPMRQSPPQGQPGQQGQYPPQNPYQQGYGSPQGYNPQGYNQQGYGPDPAGHPNPYPYTQIPGFHIPKAEHVKSSCDANNDQDA